MAAAPTEQAFQHALALHQSGQLAEAETIYRQILAVQPQHANALHLLGVIAHQVGRSDVAIDLIQQAIAMLPAEPKFHSNLGEACKNQGRVGEALAAFRRAIQLRPDYVEAHYNLGSLLLEQRRFVEAEKALRRAIELQPDLADAHENLGVVLRSQGRTDEAVAECRHVVALRPDYAPGHNNLGAVLLEQGHLPEAIAELQQAVALQPASAEAHCNLGHAFMDQGRFAEAEAAYHRALELNPGFELARKEYALLLLLHGDFERGWPLYESRWSAPGLAEWRRDFTQPRWRGEPVEGRRILLHAEQGLGDTVQFARYAPLVAARGGHVIVECQPELKTLLGSVAGIAELVAYGEPLPAFDLHCPLLSLPAVFHTTVETIPGAIPYLRADAARASRWRERLPAESPGRALKVGLVWAGGAHLHNPDAVRVDRRRSVSLAQLAPLAEVPGVIFVSLQKGDAAAQAQQAPLGMTLLDWSSELQDFGDTAALVECLDLVISVDTAVAHLAGAMGKPVWLLNRFDTCWRWLVERENTPWYPTMRLFRQAEFGDWAPVIRRVAGELADLTGES